MRNKLEGFPARVRSLGECLWLNSTSFLKILLISGSGCIRLSLRPLTAPYRKRPNKDVIIRITIGYSMRDSMVLPMAAKMQQSSNLSE
jgi:hypothetical protein